MFATPVSIAASMCFSHLSHLFLPSSRCTAQVGTKPDRLLVAGVADYVRHPAKLRLEFSDIINAGKKVKKLLSHPFFKCMFSKNSLSSLEYRR